MYVQNQPTNFVDPSGLFSICERVILYDGNDNPTEIWFCDDMTRAGGRSGGVPVTSNGRGGSRPPEDSRKDLDECVKQAASNLADRIGAALKEFGKVVGKHFAPAAVGGLVLILAGALMGNPLPVLGGAVAILVSQATEGINVLSAPLAVERLARKGGAPWDVILGNLISARRNMDV